MKRPAGVTVSAVFLILVSLAEALAGAALLIAGSFISLTGPQPPFYESLEVFSSVVFGCCALWGLTTAVGLIRMRRWARICVLLIAALLVFSGSFLLVMFLVVTQLMPEFMSAEMLVVRIYLVTTYLTAIALGLWWLIYFNHRHVKREFQAGVAQDESPRRPLSIVVIAWHAIVFGLTTAPFAVTDWPAYLFWMALSGWQAKISYLLIGVAEVAIGIGLLRLRPWSVVAATWFCVLVIAHTVVFALLPNKLARMTEYLRHYPPDFWMGELVVTDAIFWFVAVSTILTVAPALWYLLTRKKAFLEAGKSQHAAA